jgi:L-lactate dehydrogenase complex protein LldF
VSHPDRAAAFVADPTRARWHDQTLWAVRARRDAAAAEVPEWEELRGRAAAIKRHTIEHLADYLEAFEANATAHGARVHWARDADEHNAIVRRILGERGVTRVVKSKSMLTEEVGLNDHLERHGIRVVDTDLGERIVQLRREPPSHMVLPAIHLRRREVGELFAEKLGTPEGLDDPGELTLAARRHLRLEFLEAEAGISGVNFAVAETGAIVVCTNEGNADLGTRLPPLHIASMGLEKVIPRQVDLPVFLRLLARSATGQASTAYTAHFRGPRPGGELHIVLVDNGRSDLRNRAEFRRALSCIRCGACLNTCPVYRRSGGHSYGTALAGPIGSILEPARQAERFASLPFACTLCGSCTDVCPVQIDLHRELATWRSKLVERDLAAGPGRRTWRALAAILKRPALYAAAGWLGRAWIRSAPSWLRHWPGRGWTDFRDWPRAPEQSFRQRLADRERARRRGAAGEEPP